jgi:hypothetical protein
VGRIAASLILSLVVGAVPPAAAGRSATPALARVRESLRRGAACMAGQIDDGKFRDPYLRYVYPAERLPAPPGAAPLTYRQVDGYVVLALLGRAGKPPEPLATQIAGAEASLRAASSAWIGTGFSNTGRSPRPEGVALDTFCMVGWLLEDTRMAREVAAALDGDRWLPEGWYEADEAYRALSDEAWCVRLLASGGVAAEDGENAQGARRVLDRLASDFRTRSQEGAGTEANFYEAWHLGMVLAEMARSLPAGTAPGLEPAAGEDPSLAASALGALRDWARVHARRNGSDVLEWANLAGSELLPISGAEGRDLRKRSIEVLLELQGRDGCWTIEGAEPTGSGSGFASLRALLALRLYLDDRERDGGRSSSPAP